MTDLVTVSAESSSSRILAEKLGEGMSLSSTYSNSGAGFHPAAPPAAASGSEAMAAPLFTNPLGLSGSLGRIASLTPLALSVRGTLNCRGVQCRWSSFTAHC